MSRQTGKTMGHTNDRQTLLELFKNEQPIWVRNKTGKPKSRWTKPGNVILQAGTGSNIDPITILPGDDPICLSDMTDYESLKSCRDLFKSLKAKTLELLDPADAEKYYELHEGRREAMESKIDAYMSLKRTKEISNEVKTSEVHLHPRVADVCLKLRHKAMDERDALESLIETAGAFQADDYSYLLANGKLKSVKNWAKDQLAELEALELEGE